MRRFVRIDVGVLDDDALAGHWRQGHDRADVRGGEASAIETKVEVSGAFDRNSSKEHRQRKISGQRFGELARFTLQRFGQLRIIRRPVLDVMQHIAERR